MHRVDYGEIAATFDRRYARHDYSGVGEAVDRLGVGRERLLEVGCGTGHWLARLDAAGVGCIGLDPSAEMLAACRSKVPHVPVIRARGASLPIASGSLDAVLAVNALHHFGDTEAFLNEARRALRAGGALLIVGLDPARGEDRWYVYDYFEGTYERDCARYPSTEGLRRSCLELGFSTAETFVAQSYDGVDARVHLSAGGAAKESSSQLALLTQEAYDAGMSRIMVDIERAESRGGSLELRGRIHLFGTLATL